ncbi:MAG: prepilin-type N-terminal cleavage/methylation domain-containing protein [Endomicrobiales bacterium]|nr:prepilin-type N-terminal cleavage/methylation domain-containing protein [Endomicrobiales bacterium]
MKIRKMYMFKNQKGITLIELMLSIAIMGILVSFISIFMVNGLNFYYQSVAKGETQRDARACINILTRLLRQAQSSSITISRYNEGQPPCSMIQFSLNNGDAYKFYQLNNEYYVAKQFSGESSWQTSRLSTNLRRMSYIYPHIDDEDIISVSLSLQKMSYKGDEKILQLATEKVRIMN